MAIQFTDFSRAPLNTQESPLSSIFENVLKGYKMSQEPAKMKQQSSARELTNQLKQLDVDHKPKEYELNDQHKNLTNAMLSKANEHYEEKFGLDKQLKEAQINKASKPEQLKGALAAAFQLRDNLKPESPSYEQDQAAINAYIKMLGTSKGTLSETAPGEGIKINLPEGKEGYISGVGKLKPGWQSVKDAQGNIIGVNVPMSDKQVDQWKAKEKFDIIYPFLNDSLSNYSGQNSWENFTRDDHNYNKDEAAKQRIDNFFAAKKLISIGSTTENARIGGHATNVQLDELKKTLDSSEVFQKIETGSGFVLPGKYAKNAGNIFKSYLDKVEKAAKTNIPAYEFRALNPGSNSVEAGNQAATNSSQPKTTPEIVSVTDGVATVRNGGKVLKIPENLLDRYMIEHSPSTLGDGYGSE